MKKATGWCELVEEEDSKRAYGENVRESHDSTWVYETSVMIALQVVAKESFKIQRPRFERVDLEEYA